MRNEDNNSTILVLLAAGVGYWLWSSGRIAVWLAQISRVAPPIELPQPSASPSAQTPSTEPTAPPAGTTAVDRPRRGILIGGGGWRYDPGVFWYTWGGPLEPELPQLPVGWSEHGPHMIN